MRFITSIMFVSMVMSTLGGQFVRAETTESRNGINTVLESSAPPPRPANLQAPQPPLAPPASPEEAEARERVRQMLGSARCQRFIQTNGQPGPDGQILLAGMDHVNQELGSDCFFSRADYSVLCPRFASFNRNRRRQFALFLFTSIMFRESSCNPQERTPGTNDLAVGLFQLEQSQRLRRGRHPVCRGNVSVASLEFQSRCAPATFAINYCDNSVSPLSTICPVGRRCGYWEELKGERKDISMMAKQFPGCQDTPEDSPTQVPGSPQ